MNLWWMASCMNLGHQRKISSTFGTRWSFKRMTSCWRVIPNVVIHATLWYSIHDDVMKWKYFPHYWPFVQRIPTHGFPTQRPVTKSFDIFFDLRLYKRLSKQSWGWWFETQSCPLWRHCNFYINWAVKSRAVRRHMTLLGNDSLNTLRPIQNGRHSADGIFKCISLNENIWITIKKSLKFVPKGPINNIQAFVQIMAWRRPGDKPLSEPMLVSLPTHICVTQPQWINKKVDCCILLEVDNIFHIIS